MVIFIRDQGNSSQINSVANRMYVACTVAIHVRYISCGVFLLLVYTFYTLQMIHINILITPLFTDKYVRHLSWITLTSEHNAKRTLSIMSR